MKIMKFGGNFPLRAGRNAPGQGIIIADEEKKMGIGQPYPNHQCMVGIGRLWQRAKKNRPNKRLMR